MIRVDPICESRAAIDAGEADRRTAFRASVIQQVRTAIIAVHGDPEVVAIFPDLEPGVVNSRKEPASGQGVEPTVARER